MIRSELVARIAGQNPHMYAKDVERVVDAILRRIADALTDGDRVELRGFGAFSTKQMEARSGRNPRSGTRIAIPAKTTINFTMGKLMRDRLNCSKVEPEKEAQRLLRVS